MTSLNLYATKFDQVLSILDRRAPSLDYILVDTPGQIEAFTWSASGTIFTSAMASSFPTVLAFVVDTPRCATSTNTFMSNMLYACSMMYRTRLPVMVVFNKIDVVPADFAMGWMDDFDSFQAAMDETQAENGYYGSLNRSLSLVLEEFYSTLRKVGVSAITGDGIDQFWEIADLAAKEFRVGYLADLKLKIEEQKIKQDAKARSDVKRMQNDIREAP